MIAWRNRDRQRRTNRALSMLMAVLLLASMLLSIPATAQSEAGTPGDVSGVEDVPTAPPDALPTDAPADVSTEEPTLAPTDMPTEIPTEEPPVAPEWSFSIEALAGSCDGTASFTYRAAQPITVVLELDDGDSGQLLASQGLSLTTSESAQA